jgi:hypothetical protein
VTDWRPRFHQALVAKATPLGRRLRPDEITDVCQTVAESIVKEEVEAQKRAWEAAMIPAKVPVQRKRNDLLDALVRLCGGDPEQTTKSEFRTAATSLAEIKAVCPNLTVAELESRVEVYHRKHKDWALTPMSLAKWWSSCSDNAGPRTKSERSDIYQEPARWRSTLQRMYELSDAAVRDKAWLDLGPDTRREILKKLNSA